MRGGCGRGFRSQSLGENTFWANKRRNKIIEAEKRETRERGKGGHHHHLVQS
jgi:hypothetical protein